MNYNLYIKKLEEVQEKSHLENGYSHIVYQLFEIALDDEKYSIIDTSSLKERKIRQQHLMVSLQYRIL